MGPPAHILGSLLALSETPGYLRTTWQPRFNDESLIEWLIVVCYFGTALLCLRARRVTRLGQSKAARYDGPTRRRRRRDGAYEACSRFWGLLFGLFLALGVNKRLDLQSLLTTIARNASRDQGWYADRRLFQAFVISLVALAGLAGFAALLWLARRMMPRLVLAFFGAVLLAVFLLTKASSYHHLDEVLYLSILGVRVYQPLELAGILCVAVCAVLNCWWHDFGALAARLARRAPA